MRVVVDEGATQAELLHGPAQLGGGPARVLQGNGGQALETARVLADDGGEEVVGRAGIGHASSRAISFTGLSFRSLPGGGSCLRTGG